MVTIVNDNVAVGTQCGDRKTHGNPMIMVGVDPTPGHLATLNSNAIRHHLVDDTQTGKPFSHRGDTITLFHPQFFST